MAADFWTQWESVNPRMALFIKVTSKAEFGSEVMGFTTNSRDMTLPGHGGVTFLSSPGMSPTIVEQGLDEAAQLELTGVYSSDSFSQTEVMAGKWNFAEIEVFSACWDNTALGELLHFRGNLGEVKDFQTFFTCEGRGLIGRLSQDVEKVTSRLCRVKEFRDSECGHSASTVTISATVYNIVETCNAITVLNAGSVECYTLTFSGNIPPDGFYTGGKITATSGNNSGLSREVSYSEFINTGNALTDYIRVYLKRPFPYGASLHGATLTAGCNRTIEDCMKFTNITRRRAEDFVPGIEAVNRFPQQT